MWTGKPVSSATSRSIPRNNAPPPAITRPRSTRSADNSGGQRSRVMRTDSKILESGSCKASRISSERMVSVFGKPALKSRPLTSIVNSCSNGRSHRLLDHIHLPRARMGGGIFDRSFLHFRNARRHGHDHAGGNQFSMMHFLDEMAQHRFGDFEVRNDAVFHWPDGHNIT